MADASGSSTLDKAYADAAAAKGLDTGDPFPGFSEALDSSNGDPNLIPGLLMEEQKVRRAMGEEFGNLVRAARGNLTESDFLRFTEGIARREARHAWQRAHQQIRPWWDRDDPNVFWGRSRRLREYRSYVIGEFIRRHKGREHVIVEPGFYHGTVEVKMPFQGTANDGAFVIEVTNPDSPLICPTFNYAIGDNVATWFPAPDQQVEHTVSDADTNLQNPGMNLYADSIFIIEAISARLRGLRISYAGDLKSGNIPAQSGVVQSALEGRCMLWDENSEIVPGELFNTFQDSFRLAKAIGEVSSLHFSWADKAVGGSRNTTDAYIDTYLHVPGVDSQNLKRTSGGGPTLDLPTGYLWCLDKQYQASSDNGGNGIFQAELHVSEPVIYPFTPINVYGSALPAQPDGIALYWSLRLHGTALIPAKREFRSRLERM
jgi:hypothetical protein